MTKRTLLSVLVAGACIAPFMAQAASLQAASSEPYTMKASDLAKKEKELTNFPLMVSVKDTIAWTIASLSRLSQVVPRTLTTSSALKGS